MRDQQAAGIYVHVPFCRRRCPYCDFYLVTSLRYREAFVEALRREIALVAPQWEGMRFDTLYFGGGTPSQLSIAQLAHILEALHRHFALHPVEVTLEANPEDIDPDYLRGLRALGINRLSLGVQAFDKNRLAFLGRGHGESQARRALDWVQEAGLRSFNVDLIFGLPGESAEQWAAELEYALRWHPPHLSCYSLTIEPRTVLAWAIRKGRCPAPDEDQQAERFLYTHERLTGAGYQHYEVSNYALPGHESQHNRKYWHHIPYLGLGPSAHSFRWTGPDRARRWANVASLRQYLRALEADRLPVAWSEELGVEALRTEALLLGLRLQEGLDLQRLANRYGWRPDPELLRRWIARGWAEYTGDRLRLTAQGWLLTDSLLLECA